MRVLSVHLHTFALPTFFAHTPDLCPRHPHHPEPERAIPQCSEVAKVRNIVVKELEAERRSPSDLPLFLSTTQPPTGQAVVLAAEHPGKPTALTHPVILYDHLVRDGAICFPAAVAAAFGRSDVRVLLGTCSSPN